jgi:hypothetical protein
LFRIVTLGVFGILLGESLTNFLVNIIVSILKKICYLLLMRIIMNTAGLMDPQPGPLDTSVLYLQSTHRSEIAYDGNTDVVRVRRNEVLQHDTAPLDPRLIPYLQRARLYTFRRLGFMQVDHPLITAMLERWRQETHTFHLPVGECTITLQDVEVLLGLPCDGRPVICNTRDIIWVDLCARLLGKVPPETKIRGGRVRTSWLRNEFAIIPEEADQVILDQYARAYIFMFITGCLFSDHSGSLVHLSFLALLENLDEMDTYSWGSAALAWLYRQMCGASVKNATQIGGAVILIQMWAYEHISFLAPGIRSIVPNAEWQQLPLGYR